MTPRENRTETCVLADGRRVKFSLKRRGRDPYHMAFFRGPDDRPRERSTKELNKKRAADAAIVLIRDEYSPRQDHDLIPWDRAVSAMVRQMNAHNLRPGTVEDYQLAINNLISAFPKARGPAEITEVSAKEYKTRRIEKGLSSNTVAGNINKLRVIWKKWLIKECRLASINRWEAVDLPKRDALKPRILAEKETQAMFTWLGRRRDGWRLPILVLQVKSPIGCRILELCSARTDDLRDGRLGFDPETCKGRQSRSSKLPATLVEELMSLAGLTHLWERFPEQLRAIYMGRGKRRHALAVKDFDPKRFKRWLQNEKDEYLKAHEGNTEVRHFKLHNFRGTAMSRAKQAGATYDQASIAFGCHPETMRKHYLQLYETAIADAVFDKIQGDGRGIGVGPEEDEARPG